MVSNNLRRLRGISQKLVTKVDPPVVERREPIFCSHQYHINMSNIGVLFSHTPNDRPVEERIGSGRGFDFSKLKCAKMKLFAGCPWGESPALLTASQTIRDGHWKPPKGKKRIGLCFSRRGLTCKMYLRSHLFKFEFERSAFDPERMANAEPDRRVDDVPGMTRRTTLLWRVSGNPQNGTDAENPHSSTRSTSLADGLPDHQPEQM
jgi:hypothetical protein